MSTPVQKPRLNVRLVAVVVAVAEGVVVSVKKVRPQKLCKRALLRWPTLPKRVLP